MLTDQEYAVVAHRADQLEAEAEKGLHPVGGDDAYAVTSALLALSARLELIHEVLHALPERLAIDRERA